MRQIVLAAFTLALNLAGASPFTPCGPMPPAAPVGPVEPIAPVAPVGPTSPTPEGQAPAALGPNRVVLVVFR